MFRQLDFRSFFNFLGRNKLYTAINIFGLSLSLMFVILIADYTVRQLTVDSFHSKAGRIYVVSNENTVASAYFLQKHLLDRSKQSQNAVLEVVLLGQAAMGEQLRNSAGHQVDKTGGLAHEDILGALVTLLCQYAELLVGHRPKLLGGKVAAAERSGLSAAGYSGAGIH